MSQLEDLLQQCTVKLTLPDRTDWGTGFFVAPEWILTCAHVVQAANGQPVQVRWQKQENWAQAIVERSLPNPYDLALLRVTLPIDAHPPCVYLDEEVRSRDPLYLFGYPDEGDPNGEPRTFNCDGITGSEIASILFNLGQVRPGMSGSPLLNQRTGKVCGIVKFTRDRSFDLGGGAIPTYVILEQFPQLRELQREFHEGDRRWSDLAPNFSDVAGILQAPSSATASMRQTNKGGTNYQIQTGQTNTNYIGETHIYNYSSPSPDAGPNAKTFDFQPYLTAIARLYSQQNALYIPTDALLPLEARSVEQQDTQQPQERQVEQFPVLTGLRKYALGEQREHVLLAGRPGSGKSTALKQLAVALAKEGQVPVLVQLKGDRTVPELIQAEFRRAKQRVTLEQIEDWLFDDQLILLLDGVNEIPDDDLRRELAQFREDNSTVPMIFTTRELAVGSDLGIGKRLEMKPLSKPQMREFVKKYLPEHGEQLLTQLRDRLREIAETPLFLKMLCDVFKQTREIPQNKGELFQQFDRNYERLKKDYVPVSTNFWKFKSEVLQHLAFSMIQADVQKPTALWPTISKKRAESLLENWLGQRGVVDAPTKAKEWLKDLCNHHLLQDAAKPGEIEFHHQLFQEYYAAEYLLQRLQSLSDEQLKRDYLNYWKWTEAIVLMLALVEEEALALRVVKLAIDIDLRLGARLAGEIQPKFQKQPVGWIEKMTLPKSLKVQLLGSTKSVEAMPSLLRAIRDSDSSIRWDAATALGRVDEEESIQALLQASKDPHYFVGLASIQALGTIGNSAAIEALLKVSGNEIHSAYELGRLGNKIGIQKLKESLNHQEDSVVCKAISALKLLNTESSNSVLLEALRHSKSYVRKLAVQALGENGNDAWIPNLLEVLEHEDSRLPEIVSLDENVIYALGKIGGDKAITALLSITEHQNFLVRRKVLEMFGILRCKTAVSTLQEALKDENITIREIAATSLGRIGDELAVPDLLQALNNNSHVREAIARALGQIGSRDAIPSLLEMLIDKDYAVRWSASDALGRIGGEEAIAELLKLLKQSAFQTQQIAARTLGLIGNRAAIPGLIESLEKQEKLVASQIFELADNEADISEFTEETEELEEVVVRLAVALTRLNCCLGALALTQKLKHLTPYGIMWHYFSSNVFEDLEIEAAIPVLLENLNHHITNIRYAAASVLDSVLRKTQSFSETLLPVVRKSLKSSDEFVCTGVISVLRRIDNKKAVIEILESLDSPHFYVRLKIASALAELDNESAIPVLLEALHNEDILIRKDAAFALGELGSEAVVNALLRLLNNGKFKAQKEIIEALGKIGNPKALVILQKMELTSPKDGVAEAIATIRSRCKYYNYEIAHGLIPQEQAIALFFSYAPKDEALQNELEKHLSILKREGVITSWDSRQILPKDESAKVISDRLNTADIILLLISPDAVADYTCYNLEIKRAMERYQAGEARVIPILLRPVDWAGAPFSQLDVLPKNKQPVTTWHDRDEAFRQVAEGIRAVALELREVRTA